MRILLVLFLLFTSVIHGIAQETDEQLAVQYLADEEYDKAQVLFEKLLKKNPESAYFYQNYFLCLTKTKDFDGADKLIKKQIKKYPSNYGFQVDQGMVYEMQGNKKAADEHFSQLIKQVTADEEKTLQLSNAFMKRDMLSRGIETLLAGRKAAGYATAFAAEIIALYQRQGEWKKVIDESIQWLTVNNLQLEAVQSALVRVLDKEGEVTYLKERTLLQIQKYPDKLALDELLLWVFVQKKEFRSAYRQAVAMDKKSKDDGLQIYGLAGICLNNEQYDVAIECYNTLILKGKENPYYLNARMGLLETRYTKASKTTGLTGEEIVQIEQEYLNFLTEYGRTTNTAPSMKQLADCYIYYLHDLNKGIKLLEELAAMPRLQPKFTANCKLSLGDAYLMRGDVWDAQLLYGQVDKDFLEDPLGQEARLRNAKLSYFTGDFEWAKDQLDVLKTATSQLISNNAIELSMVIMDNTGLDSTTDALKKFVDAELLYFQHKLNESMQILNVMPFKFPRHSLEDDIYLLKARILVQQGQFAEAEKNYLMVVNKFGGDILADNALMELASLYRDRLSQKSKALEMYEKIVFNYTGSLFTVEARKQIQKLKDEGVTNTKL